MGYLVIAFFSVFFMLAGGALQRDNLSSAHDDNLYSMKQQAGDTLRYLGALTDHLYSRPQTSGSVAGAVNGVSPPSGVSNLISGGRLWVYQPAQAGLLPALATASGQSALIGTVKSRRLVGLNGSDMQVTVPGTIPDGYIVYLH